MSYICGMFALVYHHLHLCITFKMDLLSKDTTCTLLEKEVDCCTDDWDESTRMLFCERFLYPGIGYFRARETIFKAGSHLTWLK